MSSVEMKSQMLRSYRQQIMTLKARIKYQQRSLQDFKKHVKNGTFPKRMKSIRPYPKMETPEAQAAVNAACDQVQCVILDQVILETERKLKQDKDTCQSLMQERQNDKKQVKNSRKQTMASLKADLVELRRKYAELTKKLDQSLNS